MGKLPIYEEVVTQKSPPHIDRHHEMTLEALADVDAGRVIDYEIIQALAASLPHAQTHREQMKKGDG